MEGGAAASLPRTTTAQRLAAREWLAGLGTSAQSVFRAMDLNGDGFVTPEELAAAGAPADIVQYVSGMGAYCPWALES